MEILKIELLTDNIDETIKFYSELLGFEILHTERKTISLSVGKSILTFTKSDNLNPKYHFAFNIPCNKIDEAILWTSSRTTLIKITNDKVIADFDSWNANAIYFFDNNGNILEFIARHDLNNLSENNFGISSIYSISEIGIVTENPLKLANKIINENKLSYFAKGAKSEAFAALGDDNGLFVIVKTNRNWYPTNLPAEKFLTKIKLKTNNTTIDLTINDNNASV